VAGVVGGAADGLLLPQRKSDMPTVLCNDLRQTSVLAESANIGASDCLWFP
jgi:hypothetical protein